MKQNDITFSFPELSLLRDFYGCDLSYAKFAKEKGLSCSTFFRLVRIFENSNPEIAEHMRKEKSVQCSQDSASITSLRLENERLRTELKQAKMRAHAYDTMIDVAEEMFNIPIRKKVDTKQ